MVEYSIKSRLKSGQPCIGAWLTVPSPAVAEAMASLGFHWMAVDMEHGSVSTSDAAAAFSAAAAHGCAPFARIATTDFYLARNLLDSGAQGIIVASVDEADDFEEFAAHCVLPPNGSRSVALTRANLWGETFDNYMTHFDPVLVPMIETRRGVDAADKIAALPSVDAIFLGPYDLSSDLGSPGEMDSDDFRQSIDHVRAACERNQIAAGIHQVGPKPDELQQKLDEGFRFIAYSTDLIAMRNALNLGSMIS